MLESIMRFIMRASIRKRGDGPSLRYMPLCSIDITDSVAVSPAEAAVEEVVAEAEVSI